MDFPSRSHPRKDPGREDFPETLTGIEICLEDIARGNVQDVMKEIVKDTVRRVAKGIVRVGADSSKYIADHSTLWVR